MKKLRKCFLMMVLGLIGLCFFAMGALALSNLRLPQRTETVEILSQADKIRLAETRHLRQTVGDAVWPGWGQADIPSIAYNEGFVFLVDYPDPPAGWVKEPVGKQRGGPWEMAPGETLDGQPYYRQALTDTQDAPENFTVRVGERWVSSLQTFDWAKIRLVDQIRQDLPGVLKPVFPYRLFLGQLVSGSDQYITLVAHEAFHAYQGMVVPEKLAEAEEINLAYEGQYPWEDTVLRLDWQTELDLLAEGLRAIDRDSQVDLARSFLDLRASRRKAAGLSPALIAYEQQREWLEGLARYAELEIWRQASSGDYVPLAETDLLADFDGYIGFERRWSKEIEQIGRMADDEGDGRFYYSGMAQAFLLDALMPGWKSQAFQAGVWLEDLLTEAVAKYAVTKEIRVCYVVFWQSSSRSTTAPLNPLNITKMPVWKARASSLVFISLDRAGGSRWSGTRCYWT